MSTKNANKMQKFQMSQFATEKVSGEFMPLEILTSHTHVLNGD